MESKKNKKSGISLIVLIITIIVVIILAGAVILSLSKNNPVNTANQAVFKSNVDNYKSELQLYITDQFSKGNGTYDSTKLNVTGDAVGSIIKSMKPTDYGKFEIVNGQLAYTNSLNSDELTWAKSIGLSQGKTPYTKANAAVTEGSTSTPMTENSTITGELPTYSNPVIPAGFFAVNTDVASWNNVAIDWNSGLVIQDTAGNQFVWVPVDGTNVPYAKWCTVNIAYNDSRIIDDTFPESLNETTIANNYHGFYIGRYEASFDYNNGDIRAASKKSTNAVTSSYTKDSEHTGYLWNDMNYTNSKKYAESMDTSSGYDTTKVGTNLVTGTEWDTVLKWIQNTGIDVATSSASWGNYKTVGFDYNWPTTGTKASNTSTLLNTGATNRNSAKNIYDLAGNLIEWTSEKCSSLYVQRGSDYAHDGTAAYRYGYSGGFSSTSFGFRVALYIK